MSREESKMSIWKVKVIPQYSSKGRKFGWRFFGVFESKDLAIKAIRKAIKDGFLFEQIGVTNK